MAAVTYATGDLKGNSFIVNQSGQPYIFDPKRYVAENSGTGSQRVVMNQANVTANGTVQDAIGAWDYMKKDLLDFGKDTAFDYLPHKVAPFLLGGGMTSRTMGDMLTAVPVLGNSLSAYEALTGKPWTSLFTDNYQPLSPAERLFSAASSIPGYGNLMRIAGKEAPVIFAELSHGVESSAFHGAQFLATSDASSYVANQISNGSPELKRSYTQMQASIDAAYKEFIG